MGYRLYPNAERQKKLEEELHRVVPILAKHDVDRIILFGSLGRGEVGSASDIDLIVVKKTEKRFLDRIEEITNLIEPMCAIDILVYTPEELERLLSTNSFLKRALKEGRTIYEK